MKKPPGEITQLLDRMREGDESARKLLWDAVYDELQRIAHYRMSGERNGHTLSTTGLVHEAYFKLVGSQTQRLKNSQHFYAFASKVMREVLIDYARKNNAQRRNNGVKPESLTLIMDDAVHDGIFGTFSLEQFIDLYNALDKLYELNATWGTVVECRFFGGLTFKEIAEIIGYDTRTAERYWKNARGWLFERMSGGDQVVVA